MTRAGAALVVVAIWTLWLQRLFSIFITLSAVVSSSAFLHQGRPRNKFGSRFGIQQPLILQSTDALVMSLVAKSPTTNAFQKPIMTSSTATTTTDSNPSSSSPLPLEKEEPALPCDLSSSPYRRRLQEEGYCLVPSILTTNECQDAMSCIWDFVQDTSNFQIIPRDPTTWTMTHGWPSRHGTFQFHGAGWLLGTVHEWLAKRIFEPLYATHELYSSKEGFQLVTSSSTSSSSIATTTMNTTPSLFATDTDKDRQSSQDQEKMLVIPLSPQDESTSPTTNNSPLWIRSLTALSRGGTEHGHVYIHLRRRQEDSLSLHRIPMGVGDVLLYRSDISLVYGWLSNTDLTNATTTCQDTTTKQVPAFLHCTMAPTTTTTGSSFQRQQPNLAQLKIEAYKQRQTGTFHPYQEIWTTTTTTTTIDRNSVPLGRNYYRTSPPLVTRRQAELYGLVPYPLEENKLNDDLWWKEQSQRALIRGVRFQGIESDDDNDDTRVKRRPCPAQAIQVDTDDPHLLAGQDKYLGGVASLCGRYIYGVPGSASRVLRISTEPQGKMDWIGPNFLGKFKWLRGVEVPASAMSASVQDEYPFGCCIALSCNHLSFLKINPATNHVSIFGQEVLEKECTQVDGWYYHGGNLAKNGWIYCIPANARQVCKVNPSTEQVMMIGPVFDAGGQKWFGGIIGSDECIYGIPHNNAEGVLKIDPKTDEVSLLEGTDGPLPRGNWKWHGGLRAGHKIIGFPNNSDQLLIINCQTSTVYTIGDSSILQSGRHRIPQDGRYKYLGGALTRDGRYAYMFPCDAERVLRLDCATDELRLIGPPLLDGENKFQNGFCGRDGCLYGIPQRAMGVLRITPAGKDGLEEDHVDIIPCGDNLLGVKDKFEGGVLGVDGCIYCIPMRAKACVKIVPPMEN